jgi:hypothetical protein
MKSRERDARAHKPRSSVLRPTATPLTSNKCCRSGGESLLIQRQSSQLAGKHLLSLSFTGFDTISAEQECQIAFPLRRNPEPPILTSAFPPVPTCIWWSLPGLTRQSIILSQ